MPEFRYHRISPKFWTDEKVLSWDSDTRLLALYLLTCPHRTTEGIFRLPKNYILADLNWTPERLAKPFAQLLADRFIDYDEMVSVMLLRNALKYQRPENPNQVKAIVKSLEELPKTPLLTEFQLLAERFSEPLAKRLAERFGKPPSPTPSPYINTSPKGDGGEAATPEENTHTETTPTPAMPLTSETEPPEPKPRRIRQFSPEAKAVADRLKLDLEARGVVLPRDWHLRAYAVAQKLLDAGVTAEEIDAARVAAWTDPWWSQRLDSMAILQKLVNQRRLGKVAGRTRDKPVRTKNAFGDERLSAMYQEALANYTREEKNNAAG